ncbi:MULTISPECIES: amidohydrolase family protein [Pseudoalteromonas]|uniref:Imidazolonepropionase related amidohydrolase n=1 Tax=Pseudoalteromonas luteoviolacea (strain 2ta16) TaxID=1353533 RepID=V4GZP4_PSEL2|nr:MULTISPECIES: amidohydrolase family protein [Pseudoalteromonas]ESP90666.1 Imidazolonepropionase related amidohydrolase [Pseudoalteromonas luteoviolacea 2ta16]KZN41758.1 hypothetical protein N483_13895 [Pseudoalteromonas luteoviolacea NCIMB 1944]MCG7548083.1 amidohydrolase family protein [Pseudoalteromonas sp. Of7M-16]
MKKFFAYLLVFLIISGLALVLAYKHDLYTWEKPQQNMWIQGGTLFDATSEFATSNPGILVTDGKIACLGESCNVTEKTLIIDATGKSIMPGLIDLHGHFFGGKEQSKHDNMLNTIWAQLRFLPSVRQDLIQAGVTSYRSLGDIAPAIFDLKKSLSQDKLAGPRLFVAGPIFTVAGGHPTQRKDMPAWVLKQMTFQSDSPEQITTQIEQLMSQGIDGIKVVYQGHTDSVNDIEMPRMSRETLATITSLAEKNGLWVAAHTGGQNETIEAINTGVTSVEHGIRHGNIIRQETLDAVTNNQVTYVPTLAREPKGHLNIPHLAQSDVMLGVGTDSPVKVHGQYSYHMELKRLVDAGLSDTQAVIAATRNGAIALKKSKQLGTIEQGKLADILIINGYPWDNISDIEKIDTVIINGRIGYSVN